MSWKVLSIKYNLRQYHVKNTVLSCWHWFHPLHPENVTLGIIENVHFLSCIYTCFGSFTGVPLVIIQLLSLWKVFLLHVLSTLLLLPQVETRNFWFVLFCILSLLDFLHVLLSFWPPRLLRKKKLYVDLRTFCILIIQMKDKGLHILINHLTVWLIKTST